MSQSSPDTATAEDVLNDIRDALEARNYFHMANGRDIGLLIDELEALRSSGLAQRSPVQEALDLAVNIIMANEPGDSRAVSNEAVALAAVACGDTSDAVMKVIRAALSDTSTDRLTAAPISEETPECSICGARVFEPCRTLERAHRCELPPGTSVTSPAGSSQ